jgi:hypothetical protein
LLGRYADVQRLCASLQIDIGHTRRLLNWTPPLSVDEALTRTVTAFRSPPAGTRSR